MQARYQTPDGSVYEQRGENDFVLVEPAAVAPGIAPIVTRPADPNAANAAELARIGLERQRLALQAAREASARPPPGTNRPIPEAVATRLEGQVNSVANFDRARQGFNPEFSGLGSGIENWAQSYISSLGTPGQRDWWSDFATTDAQLRHELFGASLTPGERQAFEQTTVSPGMDPNIITQNLARRGELARQILARRANFMRANRYDPDAVSALLGEYDPAAVRPATPAATAPAAPPPIGGAPPPNPNVAQPGEIITQFDRPTMQAGPDTLDTTSEELRAVDDPALAGVNARVNAMMTRGRPDAEIRSYIQGLGIPLSDVPGLSAALQFRRQHPEYRGAYDVNLDDRLVRQSVIRRAANLAADTAPGAYLMGSANALTAGYLPELTPGNTELNRAGMDIIASRHPGADLAGNVSGGVLATLAPGAVAQRLLPAGLAQVLARAPRLTAAGTDVAYGGAYGSGTAGPEHRLEGALEGAAIALPAGAAGRAATNTLGNIVSPTGGDLNILYREGVRPTPGQRASQAGLGGRILNTFEQALQSYPVAGAAPAGARQLARDQFERGAFNRALREIGTELPADMPLGTQPHAYMQNAFDEAYTNARRGMQMQPDPQFTTDMGAVQRTVSTLTDNSQNAFNQIVRDSVGRRLANSRGVLTGDDFVQAQSEIGRKIRGLRSNPQGDRELADALDELSGALDDAAARNSPPEAVEALRAANRGYAQAVRLEVAGGMRGGGTGRFTPQQYQSAVQRTAGGIRDRQYLAGNAIGSEYAEAGRALIDTLPNSGTGERLMVNQAVAGAGGTGLAAGGFVEPSTMLSAGAFTLPYMPGVRRLTGTAMAPREMKRLIQIGNILRRYRRAGGGAAVGAAESQLPQ